MNQTTTTVIWVTGASLAGLAAIIYANRQRSGPTGPPVKFTNQNITQQFVASLPEITPELNLELATAKQVETFTQTEECRSPWGLLDLGTNTAQITVPVTCRYHVQLREAWKLEGHRACPGVACGRATGDPHRITAAAGRVSVVLCMSLERVILKSSFKAFAEILNSERTVFWNPFFGLH